MGSMKVGVIGAGWVGTERHIPGFRRVDGVEIVAVFDRHLDRAQAAVSQSGTACDDIDRFFDVPMDAVSIATPPWSHAELSIEALGRGIHVFCEKPMAMNASEAKEMVAAAEAADRVLCVSHNFLYSRSMKRTDAALAGNSIRYVMGVQLSSYDRRLPAWFAELPGGLMLDESPHMIYTLQHFLGPLSLESARLQRTGDGGIGAVDFQARGPRGIGQVIMVFDAALSEWHIGVIGDNVTVDLDLFRDIAVVLGRDRQHKALDILGTSAKAVAGHMAGFARSGALYMTKRLSWGHSDLIAAFVAAAQHGRPSPIDPAEAVGVVGFTDDLLDELGLNP